MIHNEYATTDYNLSLINKYTKKIDTGLFLLPSPTGSGKTHAIVEYIKNNLTEGKRFVYTIPVKNNLEDFKKKLIKELGNDHSREVLILMSLTDELKNWFETNELENNYLFSDWDEYKKVVTLLNIYDSLKKNGALSSYDDGELHKAGNYLINRIKKQYLDFRNAEDNKAANNLEKDTKNMFKSFDINKYSIILTTTSKFSHKVKYIDGSDYLWNLKSFENAIVFLDEFDSQKEYYLKSIITSSLMSSVDLIELFRKMSDTFKNMTYENKLDYKINDFKPIKDEFIKIYENRKLKYILDTNLLEKELENLPILIDSSFSTINLQKNTNTLYVNINEKKEELEISIESSESSYTLSELLKEVSAVINRYVTFCRNHVYNSIEAQEKLGVKDKRQLNIESFSQAKIHDSIKIFGLSTKDDKYVYLKEQIKSNLFFRKKFKKSLGKRKWNFYQNGFSLINISKQYVDSKIVDVEFLSLNKTPESMLLEACEKCVIVGVSATANINTIIKNFDIQYLKSETNFLQPTLDEINRMENLYLESKKQNNRNFVIKTNDTEFYLKDKIIAFTKRNYPKSYMNIASQLEDQFKYSNKNSIYRIDQYINFIDCYKSFLLEDKISSMLYFSNRYIQKNQDEERFNYKVLLNLIVVLVNDLEEINETIQYLKEKIKEIGNDIEKLKSERVFFFEFKKETEDKFDDYVKQNVNENRKIFVYANYKRIGSGKNLEYEDKNGDKKDFDAVFLEKPTNIILRKVKNFEDKLLGIFQIESLARNYILNKVQYSRKLKTLLNNQSSPGFYTKTEDYIQASMQIIIQAIGRLHRTNSTADMFVFIDNNLIDIINNFENKDIPLLPSAIKLKEYCSKYKTNLILKDNVFENELNELSAAYRRLISYSLVVFNDVKNEKSFEELKDIWNNIRNFVLKYPTIKSLDIYKEIDFLKIMNIAHIKVEDKSYKCYQSNDYGKISFSKVDNSYEVEVSEQAANLHLIRNCSELKEFALTNEIALEFEHNNLLIPIVFNNIYKGALGEKLGKYIVEKYCDINLDELSGDENEKYETFDYKCEEKNVYFDFKYYSQNSLQNSRNEIIQKAKTKLEKNNLEKAIIVNIFAETKNVVEIISHDDVIFIPYVVNSSNEENVFIDTKIINVLKGVLNDN